MTPPRLRAWIRKYGNAGVLLASLFLGLHYLWTKRRPAFVSGVFLFLAAAFACCRGYFAAPSHVHQRSSSQTEEVSVSSQQAVLARFRELVRQIPTVQIGAEPDPKMSEALDILIQAAFEECRHHPKITDEQVLERLDTFTQAVRARQKDGAGDDPYDIDFQVTHHIDLHTAHEGDFCAIVIRYGYVSRLGLFHLATGEKLPVPAEMRWLYPWNSTPYFFPDHSLLLVSERVQTAGFRVGQRLDSLTLKTGDCRLVETRCNERGLEMEMPIVHGDRVTILSIDAPQTFATCQADTLFPRKEIFTTRAGKLVRVAEEKQEMLRTIDAWMAQARIARRPSRQQRLIQTYYPETYVSDIGPTTKALTPTMTQVDLKVEGALLRFLVKKSTTGCELISFNAVHRP